MAKLRKLVNSIRDKVTGGFGIAKHQLLLTVISCVLLSAVVITLITIAIINKNREADNSSAGFVTDTAIEAEADNADDDAALSGDADGVESDNNEEVDITSSSSETVENSVFLSETPDAGEGYIKETLFIGDSNTVRMMNYGITSTENTIAVVGMGIQSVKTLQCVQFEGKSSPVTMIDAVKLMQPRRIIITFGTNNATGMATDDFIKKYEEALAAISEAYPYADILINAIPPICKKNSYPRLSQESIDDFNEALVALAEKLEYKFIDTASVMKDAATGYAKDGFTVGDGIHLSDTGFAAMFTYIRTHSHIEDDTRPRPLTAVPKQVKATYVIDGSGKMTNDPSSYKKMSEVSEAEKKALKEAQEAALKEAEEALKKAQETAKNAASSSTEKAVCKHEDYTMSTVREATEYEEGLRRYTCNKCGYVYEEKLPKKEKKQEHIHSYTLIEDVPATTTSAGYKLYKCSCGAVDKKVIPQIAPQQSSTTEPASSTTEPSSSATEPPASTTEPASSTTEPPEPAPAPEPTPAPEPAPSDGGNGNQSGESGDSGAAPAAETSPGGETPAGEGG